MSIVADLIAKLITAGAPSDVAAIAVAEAFAAGAAASVSGGNPVDAVAEKRRAYDRERARLKRESTGQSTGRPVDTSSALPSSINSEIQKGRKEERAEPEKPKRKSGERLPDLWMPSADHYREGAQLNLDRETVTGMARDMRLWAKSNEHRAVARKSDWYLTFSAWMRREASKHRGRAPPQQSFASLHRELSNPVEEHHDSPNLADFDGPELDLSVNTAR